MMKKPEAILDFGTSKIACLLANCDGDAFEVFGIGISEYRGIKRGKFVDESGLPGAIKNAVDIAQSEAKTKVKELYVGVPGSFVEIARSQAELELGAQQRTVHAEDIDALIEASFEAIDYMDAEEYAYIQSIPMFYKLDGSPRKDVPIGQPARMLWGAVAHIFVKKYFLDKVEDRLDEVGITPMQFVYGTFAESLMFVPKANLYDDTIIVDVGYYETDICILRNSVPVYKKTVGIGGAHFANDISHVLLIAPDVAEMIKRRHVFGLDYTGRIDAFRTVSGRVEEFTYEDVQDILEARAVELAEIIMNEIEAATVKTKHDTAIYMTGGGFAMMRGSREFFQAKTGFNLKYSLPWLPRLNSANYASMYGTLKFVYNSGMQKKSVSSDLKNSTLVKALINFFTK